MVFQNYCGLVFFSIPKLLRSVFRGTELCAKFFIAVAEMSRQSFVLTFIIFDNDQIDRAVVFTSRSN